MKAPLISPTDAMKFILEHFRRVVASTICSVLNLCCLHPNHCVTVCVLSASFPTDHQRLLTRIPELIARHLSCY